MRIQMNCLFVIIAHLMNNVLGGYPISDPNAATLNGKITPYNLIDTDPSCYYEGICPMFPPGGEFSVFPNHEERFQQILHNLHRMFTNCSRNTTLGHYVYGGNVNGGETYFCASCKYCGDLDTEGRKPLYWYSDANQMARFKQWDEKHCDQNWYRQSGQTAHSTCRWGAAPQMTYWGKKINSVVPQDRCGVLSGNTMNNCEFGVRASAFCHDDKDRCWFETEGICGGNSCLVDPHCNPIFASMYDYVGKGFVGGMNGVGAVYSRFTKEISWLLPVAAHFDERIVIGPPDYDPNGKQFNLMLEYADFNRTQKPLACYALFNGDYVEMDVYVSPTMDTECWKANAFTKDAYGVMFIKKYFPHTKCLPYTFICKTSANRFVRLPEEDSYYFGTDWIDWSWSNYGSYGYEECKEQHYYNHPSEGWTVNGGDTLTKSDIWYYQIYGGSCIGCHDIPALQCLSNCIYANDLSQTCKTNCNPGATPSPVTPTTTTSTPTRSPTRKPTQKPTTSPVRTPTRSPTHKPTTSPIRTPTKSPIRTPTRSPTRKPTSKPTTSPIRTPTKSPIRTPTRPPTRKPTAKPTALPTRIPSNRPSTSPTLKPTEPPVTGPTKPPTSKPTALPTRLPTRKPTQKPTAVPSNRPSTSPTLKPTEPPVTGPTRPPTSKPTALPTISPTLKPTQPPVSGPTKSPTTKPSISPTKSPSMRPSDTPTASPSQTTDIPSDTPTASPTQTTTNPTDTPTHTPSDTPTSPPTLIPTRITQTPNGETCDIEIDWVYKWTRIGTWNEQQYGALYRSVAEEQFIVEHPHCGEYNTNELEYYYYFYWGGRRRPDRKKLFIYMHVCCGQGKTFGPSYVMPETYGNKEAYTANAAWQSKYGSSSYQQQEIWTDPARFGMKQYIVFAIILLLVLCACCGCGFAGKYYYNKKKRVAMEGASTKKKKNLARTIQMHGLSSYPGPRHVQLPSYGRDSTDGSTDGTNNSSNMPGKYPPNFMHVQGDSTDGSQGNTTMNSNLALPQRRGHQIMPSQSVDSMDVNNMSTNLALPTQMRGHHIMPSVSMDSMDTPVGLPPPVPTAHETDQMEHVGMQDLADAFDIDI